MLIHPLFVHFPIAFLIVYALCEFVPVSLHKNAEWWGKVKAFLIVVGWLALIPTLITGTIAESIVGSYDLVAMHKLFALLTACIFTLFFVAHVVRVCLLYIGDRFSRFLLDTYAAKILALVGLISITITGALGAAIAHGPDADFVVSFIYRLFF